MNDLMEEIAVRILEERPGPVVQYRLLRDVLKVSRNSTRLKRAKDNLQYSQSIGELAAEQRPDGGWGAFHSRDTESKQRVPTTEVGVERALSLGLDASHPILQQVLFYIVSIMQGDIGFPDNYEKNNRWKTGMRMFLAATLSRIHPTHPILDRDRRLWHEIAIRTLQSGAYNARDEVNAHLELTGAYVKDSYLVLNHRYQLNILGSIPRTISEELETALLQWLWEKLDGIGYLGVPLYEAPSAKPASVDNWFTSLEMMSRLFPTWVNFAKPSIEWLWKQRNGEGFWDFGPRPRGKVFLPLSDNWRRRKNRMWDWSTRVLLLLKSYDDGTSQV